MRRRVVTMGLVAVCCLAACTPGGSETPSPSPSVPSVTATPSVTPTPSLSPSEEAEKDASKAFTAYIQAMDVLGRNGGADTLPANLQQLTTGPERDSSLAEARALKAGRFKRSGSAQLKNLGATRITGKTPAITGAVLAGCLDQTHVTVTKNGQPYEKVPKYVVFTEVTMVVADHSWRVYQVKSAALDGGRTCESY